ncbi:formate dehydrogenase subunit delta [Neopusillimonas aromaticivorans]|uniref:formate dehydrogenase subunit delta n=1 Tax=Neopusillimonas aromaticivorans TaxID=2979868 RepID=UPI00259450E7|nr:formate dehydrogenase subunit delta [Neopusillimonas aromaticivorans]WJJ92902.1 formate dehydrogenase subunit delta [Neopusillimonas aromaticivorans]
MKIEQLIKMANQIGDFFAAMPDRDEGLDGVASHIEKFWEPRMRTALLNFLDTYPNGTAPDIRLNELTLAAVSKYRDRLLPRKVA